MNQTNSTDYQCSTCYLKTTKSQLESPFGYDEGMASAFDELTSSCGDSRYGYATPTTAIALKTTTATVTEPIRTCASTYTIQVNDTCAVISNVTGVSADKLTEYNGPNKGCGNLPEAGETLCVPTSCGLHRVDFYDACWKLIEQYDIIMAQLLAWNPIINSGCTNLDAYLGWYICVTDSATITAVSEPINAKSDSNEYCATWYTVVEDDTCALISVEFGITLDDFEFLNPGVWGTCTNLWLGYAYCVDAVGDISTYSGYPVETPTTSFTRPATTEYSYVAATTAAGTVEDCYKYQEAVNPTMAGEAAAYLNDCDTIASSEGITVEELAEWNPSLPLEANWNHH